MAEIMILEGIDENQLGAADKQPVFTGGCKGCGRRGLGQPPAREFGPLLLAVGAFAGGMALAVWIENSVRESVR